MTPACSVCHERQFLNSDPGEVLVINDTRKRKRSRSRTGISGDRRIRIEGRRDFRLLFKSGIRGLPSRLFAYLQEKRWLCMVPLLLLLSITACDFLILTHVSDAAQSLFFEELPVPYNDSRRDAAELLKTDVLQYVYLFLFFVCTLHWRKILGYFRAWPHFVLIFALLSLGVFYSLDPIKVVTNTILIIIATLAAVLFASAYARRGQYDSFYHVVFWPIVSIHLASLFILTLYDVNIFEFLLSTRRYGGLAGNPNSLGATAVLGVWAAIGLFLSPTVSRTMRIVAALGLLLFFFNTALSGSGTSTATILLVLLALAWLRLLAALSSKGRFIVNVSLVVIAVFVCLYALLLSTPAEMFLNVTGSMGKDATLSGRTDLWAIAREAISLRPFFGWGFDSHQSVMSVKAFNVRFNHYHNGYLDTMIAGGVCLLAVVLYNLFRFSQVFLRTFRVEPAVFPLLLPLIILMVLNLSEYSLLRPNSQLWLVYMIAFAMLTYDPLVSIAVRFKFTWKGRGKSRSASGRNRSRKKLRWA